MFPTFKSKDEIPKGFEAAYEEKGGEWVAKLPDTGKLEETLAKVRGEKKDAEKLARDNGDRASDLQRQLDAKNASGADTDKKVSEMLATWNKDKDAAVKVVQDQLDAASGELRTMKVDDQIKAIFTSKEVGGRAEKASATLKLTKDRFDLVDGKLVMKDDKGVVTTTSPVDFFKAEFRKEQAEFYVGTQATGGGAAGATLGGATPSGLTAEQILANPSSAFVAANKAA